MNDQMVTIFALLASLVAMIALLATAALFATLFLPWLRALSAGAPIRVMDLLGMRLRGIPPRLVVDALVTLVHRGHPHDSRTCVLAQKLYLARRGLIHTAQQLADLTEQEFTAPARS